MRIHVCIWYLLYFDMGVYVYHPHFTLRCECMYMVVTGIKYHYPNIPPNCMYIRYLCLGQATTWVGLTLGEIGSLYIYVCVCVCVALQSDMKFIHNLFKYINTIYVHILF